MDKSIRNIVKEEFSKIFEDAEAVEAEVSSALSFMQDMQGSMNRFRGQKKLGGTSTEVDHHIDQAMEHIGLAIQAYLGKMSPEAKSEMTDRMGEINIDK